MCFLQESQFWLWECKIRVITHSNMVELGFKPRSFWLQRQDHDWLSHLSPNCHMAQASPARDSVPPSHPTCSPVAGPMAASPAGSVEGCGKNTLWHLRMLHKVCQREEQQLVNSWQMDIFMQGLPREMGKKSEITVYKGATINKVFVSFLDLDFQVLWVWKGAGRSLRCQPPRLPKCEGI